jgi:hypothetical protein
VPFVRRATRDGQNRRRHYSRCDHRHDKHSDRFDFRVWPRAVASKGTVSVFDPEGKTTAMLRALGYTVAPWNGQSSTQYW